MLFRLSNIFFVRLRSEEISPTMWHLLIHFLEIWKKVSFDCNMASKAISFSKCFSPRSSTFFSSFTDQKMPFFKYFPLYLLRFSAPLEIKYFFLHIFSFFSTDQIFPLIKYFPPFDTPFSSPPQTKYFLSPNIFFLFFLCSSSPMRTKNSKF